MTEQTVDDVLAPFDGERSGEGLDIYRRSTDVMRETVKWIVSFVPGAALIVTLAGVIPGLATLHDDELRAPIAWLSVATLAALSGLTLAARVLRATPPSWDEIVDTYRDETQRVDDGRRVRKTSLSNELDHEGFLRLYGYDSMSDYIDHVNRRHGNTMKIAPGPASLIVDFALLRELRGKFTVFLIVGTLTAIIAVIAVALAQFEVERATDPTIEAPIAVTVEPTNRGLARLEDLGCATTTDAELTAVAVGGTLERADLLFTSETCTSAIDVTWDANRDGLVVPTPRG